MADDGHVIFTLSAFAFIEGMKIDDVIAKCKGIQCRAGTSCPDQLATALEQLKAQRKEA